MEYRSSRPAAVQLARMVLDRSGRRWRIAETVSRTTDPSAVPCLVLSTDNRYVRLRRYPDRWMSLPVEDLLELARAEDQESHPPSRLEASHQNTEGSVAVPAANASTGMQQRTPRAADDHVLTK